MQNYLHKAFTIISLNPDFLYLIIPLVFLSAALFYEAPTIVELL